MRRLNSGSWPADLTLERVRRLHLDTDAVSALSFFAIMPCVFPELDSLSLTCEEIVLGRQFRRGDELLTHLTQKAQLRELKFGPIVTSFKHFAGLALERLDVAFSGDDLGGKGLESLPHLRDLTLRFGAYMCLEFSCALRTCVLYNYSFFAFHAHTLKYTYTCTYMCIDPKVDMSCIRDFESCETMRVLTLYGIQGDQDLAPLTALASLVSGANIDSSVSYLDFKFGFVFSDLRTPLSFMH